MLRSYPSSRKSSLLGPVTLATGLCLLAGTAGASVTLINPNAGPLTGGAAVSADGNVVVLSYFVPLFPSGATGGFGRWTQAGGLVWGPNLSEQNSPTATNADGTVIVGENRSSDSVRGPAFRWRSTSPNSVAKIGVLAGNSYARAADVSADGNTVVGSSFSSGQQSTAFRWTSATGATSLGSVPGFNQSSAKSITPDGSTIFGSLSGPGVSGVFRWTSGTGMTQVAALNNLTSVALSDVSSNGATLVGNYAVNGVQTGFAWNAQSGLKSFSGTFFYPYVTPTCVTADGSVVFGYIANSTAFDQTQRAFVWSAWTGLIDLNDYLASQGVSNQDFTISSVRGCSADGLTLACIGQPNSGSDQTALILRGVPSPSGLSTLLVAGTLGTRRRRPTK